ncbi:MAG TPA: GNAT family N-acetyltransferase [Vicinamibacterales bacterium]|jgi:GNAT superfamily N-acetyltransferase|nr:GNAT family N-acetyltransferase [Vicinamibacterales bacterium]
MAEVDRFRPEDRRGVEALYRRVFGIDAAEAYRLRWDWQYRRNPLTPPEGPLIWIAREGTTIVGQCAALPVKLTVRGREIDAAWGTDVMVAPERQRQGLGELLFRAWDRHVGAALGLDPSEAAYRLFRKLGWPDLGAVPCLVKPLTRRAVRLPRVPVPVNRLLSAVTYPVVQIVARTRPLRAQTQLVRRFDGAFDDLWARLAGRFDVIVRRDSAYLTWRYLWPPHVRYSIVTLEREGRVDGFAVFRHAHEPLGRVTLLVDLLADPDDVAGLKALLRRVDREARAADSDKIRCFTPHAALRRVLRRSGYFQVRSTLRLVAKINAIDVPPSFYRSLDGWHITLGDSDVDR